VAVFVAGLFGSVVVLLLLSVLGSYAASFELTHGSSATPRQLTLIEVIGLLIAQALVLAAIGALLLPGVLRWMTDAEISWFAAALGLAAGVLVNTGTWWVLVGAGAPTTGLALPLVTLLAGIVVAAWIVRIAVSRQGSEPSRLGVVVLLLGLPVVVALGGWLVLSGFSLDTAAERLDGVGYQAATLEAQQAFAAGYRLVESSGRAGPGFDPTTYGVQGSLRDAAEELERGRPPREDLDEAHAGLASGLRAFADGLEALEDQPLGSDPADALPYVDGLEEIRVALLRLRAAGYRVNPTAWRLVA
jgi:hypothetical protein